MNDLVLTGVKQPFIKQSDTSGKKTSENSNDKAESERKRTSKEDSSAVTLTLQKYGNQDDMKNNYQSLLGSIKSANENTEDASSQQLMKNTLEALVKSIRMLNRMHYDVKSWNRLMKAMGKAEGIMIADNPSLADIRKAIGVLRNGLAGLRLAEKEEKGDGEREGLPLVLKLKSGSEGASAPVPAISSSGAVSSSTGAPSISISVNVSV